MCWASAIHSVTKTYNLKSSKWICMHYSIRLVHVKLQCPQKCLCKQLSCECVMTSCNKNDVIMHCWYGLLLCLVCMMVTIHVHTLRRDYGVVTILAPSMNSWNVQRYFWELVKNSCIPVFPRVLYLLGTITYIVNEYV